MTFVLPFICSKTDAAKVASVSQPPDGSPPANRPGFRLTSRRRRAFRLTAFLAVFTVIGLTGPLACTPNLGGDNVGWAPLTVQFATEPGDPVRVYVASPMDGDLDDLGSSLGRDLGDDERRVKIRALEDFGSGTPQVAWTYPPLGSGAGLEGVFGLPAVSPELGLVFVSGVDGYVYAISSDTGSDAAGWKKAVRTDPAKEPQPLISGPVLTNVIRSDTGPATILLVASEDGNLYAYQAATGEELPWSPFATEGKIWSTPTVLNSIAYFGSQDHHIYAVDLRNGRELWRFKTGGSVVSDPLLFDGMVIAGAFDKKLYALDADDGELEWEFQGSNWFWAGPVTDGETIFAPSMDGNVYALDSDAPTPGEPKEALWQHDMASPVVATPALVPLGLVVATVDGRMRLLSTSPANLEEGEVLSNLPSLEGSEIKSPLAVGAPPVSPGVGADLTNLAVIQRHSIFVSGDSGVVRRIAVTEGQDKESIWCYDTGKHEPCN